MGPDDLYFNIPQLIVVSKGVNRFLVT
jgi:hypothetical protein